MKNESHHHDNACNENTRLEYFEIWLNKNKNITTSLKFIKTLKKGISILLFPNISSNRMFLYNSKYIPLIKREDLSKFLGQKNSHIKELTRRATINPNYKIGLEFLQEYEFNMKKEVNKNNIAIKT